MATRSLITWNGPEYIYIPKTSDWYWAVGIVTLALAAVALIFGEIITGILVIVAATALVLRASRPAHHITCLINDRGIVVNDALYPFVSIESFWIPHDSHIPKLILKSRKMFMPLIILYVDPASIDLDEIREVLVQYIAETEHHEHFLKHMLDGLGF